MDSCRFTGAGMGERREGEVSLREDEVSLLRENKVSSSSRTYPPSPSHHHRTTHPTPHHERPSSPWRTHRSSRRSLPASSLLMFLLLLTCCISLSSASHFYIDEEMIESIEAETSEDLGAALARLAKSGTILVDQGPPPNPKAWTLATEHDDLQRRGTDDHSSSSSSSTPASTSSPQSKDDTSASMITTATTTGTRSGTKTSSSTGIAVATTASNSPLPSPFDQGFSGNITSSCQSFMDAMLANATFKACLPFSLLLQVRCQLFLSGANSKVFHVRTQNPLPVESQNPFLPKVKTPSYRKSNLFPSKLNAISYPNPILFQTQHPFLFFPIQTPTPSYPNPNPNSPVKTTKLTNSTNRTPTPSSKPPNPSSASPRPSTPPAQRTPRPAPPS